MIEYSAKVFIWLRLYLFNIEMVLSYYSTLLEYISWLKPSAAQIVNSQDKQSNLLFTWKGNDE